MKKLYIGEKILIFGPKNPHFIGEKMAKFTPSFSKFSLFYREEIECLISCIIIKFSRDYFK